MAHAAGSEAPRARLSALVLQRAYGAHSGGGGGGGGDDGGGSGSGGGERGAEGAVSRTVAPSAPLN
eukprot:COSAG01_NODE_1115_length_11643_cov_197.836798_8_plen_66_part_00